MHDTGRHKFGRWVAGWTAGSQQPSRDYRANGGWGAMQDGGSLPCTSTGGRQRAGTLTWNPRPRAVGLSAVTCAKGPSLSTSHFPHQLHRNNKPFAPSLGEDPKR